jgi:NDP-sugar pyrophosphorylase family protein
MQALILAAGLGTRIREESTTIPKALIEAGGEPMLYHVILRLKKFGFNEIFINTFYLGDKIKEYLSVTHIEGVNITLLPESERLGTAGGILNALNYVSGSSLLVHNCDVFSEIDLSQLQRTHDTLQNDVTLAVQNRVTSRPLLFNEECLLVGMENHDEERGEEFGHSTVLHKVKFTGIQIINTATKSFFTNRKPPSSSIDAFISMAKEGKRVFGATFDEAYWIDMGTPEKLRELRLLLGKREELC